MREKDIKQMSEKLSGDLGVEIFGVNDVVDMAESSDFSVIFVNGEILAMVTQGRPFLTVRGFLKYKATKRFITVDMGAVPFVTKGADVMGPGIVDADPGIQPGDLVWVRDMKFLKPLAVGESLVSGKDLAERKPGKAVKSLIFVGDKLWKYGEEEGKK
jgi:PUA domain protein